MSSAEGNTLPNGWEEKTLSEVCDVRDGTHDSPKYIDKGFPLITSKNLKNGHLNFEKIKYISEADYNSINKRSKVDVGDILFAMIGTIGNPVLIKNQPNYAIKNVALFKKKSNDVLMTFLKYFLVNPIVIDKMTNEAKGATQKFVGLNYLRSFKITIPPLKEQKHIVAKIDTLFARIDKAISLTEESLKQAKNLLPSVLKEVFEKGKADGWEEKKLEEVCDVIGGGTPKTKISEYWNGEIVWLSPIDLPPIGEISMVRDSRKKITEIGLKKSSAKLLPKGSVVYSTRASIGKIAIAEIPLSTNQGFTNFICGEGLNNRYLCFCLKHFNENIENLSNSTTFKEVSKSSVKEFEIPVPSIDSQMKVVKIADDVLLKSKQTQSKLEEQLAYLKQLKSSILSKAFKGEL